MSDWTSGYVADIDYTYGYYGELNPLHAQLAFRFAGLAFPKIINACELGFGQGMSTNLHAASTAVNWYGTDFNPAQAAFARELAEASGGKAHLFDQAFDEFCQRSDLPEFDFIGLHGIWSWVSDTNRAIIVDFIRRKLKVGGVLFVSYNCQPGWAQTVPMRDLLTEHSEVMGTAGQGILSRIDQSLKFAERLFATKPNFVKTNPQVLERLKLLSGQNRNYLAHEYFNRDWCPMPFSKMAEWLAPAKLSYACSANLLDNIDVVNMTPEQIALIQEVPDANFRQTLRDFMVNQAFRRDYWVRGARETAAHERVKLVADTRLMLVRPRADVKLTIKNHVGEVNLQPDVYVPLLDFLADHKPRSVHELCAVLPNVPVNSVVQAAMVLAGTGALTVVQDPAAAVAALPTSRRFNDWIMQQSLSRNELTYLSSPVTGAAHLVLRFSQLFLMARAQGMNDPEQWAKWAWEVLKARGQRCLKDGQVLETEADNLAEMLAQAIAFRDQQLPIIKALGITQ